MKFLFFTTAPVLLFMLAGTIGCDTGTETADEQQVDQQQVDQQQAAEPETASEQQPSAGEASKQYPIGGEVVAVNPEKPSVTLDHEEIEGLMKAMQMEFQVDSPQVLEGIQQGDSVQGQLVKKDGEFLITDLKKRPE